jgi:hypothetical protein
MVATREEQQDVDQSSTRKSHGMNLTHTPMRLIEMRGRPRRIFALELNDVIFNKFNAMNE